MTELLNTSFLKELLSALPETAVLRSPDERRPYECDGLSGYKALPGVVVLPDTLESQAFRRTKVLFPQYIGFTENSINSGGELFSAKKA